MRKSFFVGVVTLLPVLVTYIIIMFGIKLITAPFEYVVRLGFERLHVFNEGLGVFTQSQIIHFLSRLFIIAFLVLVIFLSGFFAQRILFHPIGLYIENFIRKIPVIGSVYGPMKELITMLLEPKEQESPKQTAFVPYPSQNQLAIAIVTGEYTAKLADTEEAQTYVSVLVPSTPNATNGYLLSFKKEDVTPFDMPADEALKYIMSFGVIKA